MNEEQRAVVEAAHLLLTWAGMDYNGTRFILPDDAWSHHELNNRTIALREALARLEAHYAG